MAYQITQINDLEQFGELNTTYLLVDDAGVMPDVRIDKIFKLNENLEKIIENDKILTCLFYENEWLNRKFDTVLWWDNLEEELKIRLFDTYIPESTLHIYGNKQALADLMYEKYNQE